jgi:pyroglutamyl-peptidase
MPRVLITAFGPYQSWTENSSWLTLVELTKNMPDIPEVTTRLYPVDLIECREKLATDLELGFDYAIHLGQAPGAATIRFESFAINVFDDGEQRLKIDPNGPAAFETNLPVTEWVGRLRESGLPATQSDHAGTYLCNAIYYLSQQLAQAQGLKTQSLFVHLPIGYSQAIDRPELPSMAVATGAAALLRLLGWLAEITEF